jgi:hypothetical protein
MLLGSRTLETSAAPPGVRPAPSPPRRSAVGAAVLLAACLATTVAASEEGSPCTGEPLTCNGSNTLCCNWWVADVILDGKTTGAVLENSYEKLIKGIESHNAMSARLCKYWGTHDDCASTLGPPRCSGAFAGAAKQVLDAAGEPLAKTLNEAQTQIAESSAVARALDTFGKVSDVGTSLAQGKSPQSIVADEVMGRIRAAAYQNHIVLDEYVSNLEGAVNRARGLRNQLSECLRTHNPFLELDPASDTGGGLPRIWQTAPGGGSGFVQTLPFSSPSGRRGQLQAADDGRRSIDGLVKGAPKVPAIGTLHLDGPTPVAALKTGGSGRLLIGGVGSLRPQTVLPAGDYPLLFASVRGEAVTFASVAIDRRPKGGGEAVTIRGSAEGNEETVELLVCSGGREARQGQCQCPTGLQWSGTACECPQGQHFEGDKCRSCPAKMTWNGQSCQCPDGAHLERGQCLSCPNGKTWNGSACECSGGATWNGSQCVAPAATSSVAPRLMTWQEASSYCATLSEGGGGWRLPTRGELRGPRQPLLFVPGRVPPEGWGNPTWSAEPASPEANGYARYWSAEISNGQLVESETGSEAWLRAVCVR